MPGGVLIVCAHLCVCSEFEGERGVGRSLRAPQMPPRCSAGHLLLAQTRFCAARCPSLRSLIELERDCWFGVRRWPKSNGPLPPEDIIAQTLFYVLRTPRQGPECKTLFHGTLSAIRTRVPGPPDIISAFNDASVCEMEGSKARPFEDTLACLTFLDDVCCVLCTLQCACKSSSESFAKQTQVWMLMTWWNNSSNDFCKRRAGKRVWTLNHVQLDYVLARGADGIPPRKSSALFEGSVCGQTTQVCDLRAHQNVQGVHRLEAADADRSICRPGQCLLLEFDLNLSRVKRTRARHLSDRVRTGEHLPTQSGSYLQVLQRCFLCLCREREFMTSEHIVLNVKSQKHMHLYINSKRTQYTSVKSTVLVFSFDVAGPFWPSVSVLSPLQKT